MKNDKPTTHLNVDLSSSLLITPTASPTNLEETKPHYDFSKPCPDKHYMPEDENANTRFGSFSEEKCFGYETPIHTDLDIELIEEDGTLNDNGIHNTYIFSS